jgi:hypothetical protein
VKATIELRMRVTPEQYRAAHDLIAYALRPHARDDDPDVRPLKGFFQELKRQQGPVLCGECEGRIVYAKGLCRGCYQRQRRAS